MGSVGRVRGLAVSRKAVLRGLFLWLVCMPLALCPTQAVSAMEPDHDSVVRYVLHAPIARLQGPGRLWRARHSVPVTVTLREQSGEGVWVELSIPEGAGTLTAFFGNVLDEELLPGLRALDPDGNVTDQKFRANRVRRFAHANHVLPVSRWDFGVVFGDKSAEGDFRGDPWSLSNPSPPKPIESVRFLLAGRGVDLRQLLGAAVKGWRLAVRVRSTGPHNHSVNVGLRRRHRPMATGPAVRIGYPAAGAVVNVSPLHMRGGVSGTGSAVDVNGVPASVRGKRWRARVRLREGVNRIVATATNPLGTASHGIEVVLDQSPPVVTITAPASGDFLARRVAIVSGTLVDATEIQKVRVNGVIARWEGGIFRAEVPLHRGENLLVARAVDAAGNLGMSRAVRVVLATCRPGSQRACYDGPDGSEGVGLCSAGLKICRADGSAFGPCRGQSLPELEACNGVDDDCDGASDEDLGETSCGLGLCQHSVPRCDAGLPGSCDPFLGMQEELCGNDVDDDCDGVVDEETECLDRIAPQVVESSLSDEDGVGICDSVVVHWSEPLQSASVTADSVQLFDSDSSSVDGEVRLSHDGLALVFDPSAALNASSPHTLRVVAVKDAAGNALESPFEISFETQGSDSCDTLRPRGISTAPSGEANTNTPVTILFDERMDPTTFTPYSMRLSDLVADVDVPGRIQVNLDGRVASFVPDAPLAVGRLHYFYLTPDVKDLAGNVLLHSSTVHRRSDFKTGFSEGASAPTLVLASPPDGAQDVKPNGQFVLIFDEAIWTGAVGSVELRQNGQPVAASFSWEDGYRRLRVRPSEHLLVGAEVEIELFDRVRNRLGAPLTNPGTLRFFVGGELATKSARILHLNPTRTIVRGVLARAGLNVNPAAEFTVPVDPGTVTTATVTLRESLSGEWVAGRVVLSEDGLRASFHPAEPLQPYTGYRLELSGVIARGSGWILSTRSTGFSTGPEADHVRPRIVAGTPAADARDVPSNTTVSVHFDEPMNPLSVGVDAVRLLEEGIRPVDGSMVLASSSIRFYPTEPLRAATWYTLEASGFRDVADNAVIPFSSEFRTAGFALGDVALSDLARLGASTSQVYRWASNAIDGDLDTDWCPDPSDTEPYIEVVLPGTAAVTEVSLVGSKELGRRVWAGIFDLFGPDGELLTTTGEVLLPPETPQRLSVPVGGPEGISAVTRVRFSITQAESGSPCLAELQVHGGYDDAALERVFDRTPPVLIEVTPESLARDVALDAPLVLRFDEPMQRPSLSLALLDVYIDGESLDVPGTFSVMGATVTFRPDDPWPAGGTVSYRFTGQDLAGNTSRNSLSFSTLEGIDTPPGPIDTTPPELVLITPQDGAEGIGEVATIQLLFSEPLDPETIGAGGIDLFGSRKNSLLGRERSVDNRGITLTVTGLLSDTEYAVVVTDQVSDLAGNRIATSVHRFRTARFGGNRPKIVTFRPYGRAQGVDPETAIVVYTDSPLDPVSVEAGFFVSENGSLMPGVTSLASSESTITFTPARPFEAGALVEVFATDAIVDPIGNRLKEVAYSFTIADFANEPAYAVSLNPSTYSGVPANTVLAFRYSEAIDASTVNGDTVTLTKGGEPIAGVISLSADGRLVRFVPDEELEPFSYYDFVASGLVGSDGGDVNQATRRFRAVGPDFVAPSFSSISPPDGAVAVGVNARLKIRFDEPLSAISVDEATIVIAGPGGESLRVSFALSKDDSTVIVRPQDPLVANTLYRVVVAGVTDVAGNLAALASSEFSTGAGSDVSPPSIRFHPAGKEVPINTTVQVVLSEPVDPATVGPDTIRLSTFETPEDFPGTVSLSSDWRRITFVPDRPLPVGAYHSWSVGPVADVSGNEVDRTYNFTTSYAEDREAPSLEWVHPAVGTGGEIPLNVRVIAKFDESLSANYLRGVSLAADGVPVSSLVSLDDGKSLIAIQPDLPLDADTEYVVRIEGVRDLAGNEAAPSVARFTTGTRLDTTTSSIVDLNPRNNAPDVPTNAVVSFGFSQWINAESVEVEEFRLISERGDRIAGDVFIADDGLSGSFTPVELLEPVTEYDFTISPFAFVSRAAAKRSRYNRVSSSFTTGHGPDDEAPTVVTVSPPPGATGVPTNVAVEVRLSEPLDRSSLADDVIRIFIFAGGDVVLGVLEAEEDLLRFVPEAELAPGTEYTVAIGGARDIAGNEVSPLWVRFETSAIPNENLSLAPLAELAASSEAVIAYRADRGADGDLDTFWCSVSGEAASRGAAPFFEVSLPGAATVTSLFVQTTPSYRLALAGVFDLFAIDGSWLESTGEVELAGPSPLRASVPVGGVTGLAGVGRVRFTVTEDTPEGPCISELGVVGTFEDPSFAFFTDTTRPSLVNLIPAEGAVDVVADTEITLVYDEPIAPVGPDEMGVSVSVSGVGSWEGDLQIEGGTVSFVPDHPLPPLRAVELRVRTLTDLAGNPAYSLRQTFTTGILEVPDTTPPVVVAATPANGEIDVKIGSSISLTFSEPLDPASFRDAFAIFVNGRNIGYQIRNSSDNTVVILGLASRETSLYAVVATDKVTDLSGNPLANFATVFATGPRSEDEVRPRIVSARPGNGSLRVDRDTSIVLHADEPIDPTTILDSLFVSQDGVLVEGTQSLTSSAATIEFVPEAPWNPGAMVRLFVPIGSLRDLAGNPVHGFTTTFSIAPDPATEEAFVEGWSPGALAPAPLNAELLVGWSEPLDPSTIDTRTVSLRGDALVDGIVSLEGQGRIIRFEPLAPLAPNTNYQLLISPFYSHSSSAVAPMSADGDYLHSTSLRFETGTAEDHTPPELTSLSPSDGGSGVGVNALVAIQFDEAVNPLSVNGDTLRMSGPFTEVLASTFSFGDENRSVLLTPHTPLAAEALHTIRVAGVTDVAGNPVAELMASFTTASGPDTTPPQLRRKSPPHGSTVATNVILRLEFDSVLDRAGVAADAIRLLPAGLPEVPGVVSLDEEAKILTFRPDAPLAPGTSYTWSSDPVSDVSGNTGRGIFTLRFKTGAEDDLLAPRVVGTSPADGAAFVPTNARVIVEFDAPVSSVGGVGVSLWADGEEVPVNLALDHLLIRATLQPVVPLNAEKHYEIRIEGVRDFSGNVADDEIVGEFSTGLGADLTALRLSGLNPASGPGAPTNVLPRVLFSDLLDPLSVDETSVGLEVYGPPWADVAGRVELGGQGRLVTFVPDALLEPLTSYRLELDRVRSVVGLDYSPQLYFQTGELADFTSPEPLLIEPADGATAVGATTRVALTLNETINLATLPGDAISLRESGGPSVPGTQSASGTTLDFLPDYPLAAGTVYIIEVDGVTDAADNPLAPFTSTFTTTGTKAGGPGSAAFRSDFPN